MTIIYPTISGAGPAGSAPNPEIKPPKPQPSAAAPSNGKASDPPKPALPSARPSRSDWMPCSIVFLTGPYMGQTLDLGLAINDSSHSQAVTWDDQKARSIRVGATFSHVGPREIKLKLQFFSLNEDVSPQAENCMTLAEIDEKTGNPGLLVYREGAMTVQPLCVDGTISIEKSEPIAGGKGFRLADMTIPLKLMGGKISEWRLAQPLMETELTRWKASKTEAEKQREGKLKASLETLAACLTKSENEQLSTLIADNKLSDPRAVAGLSKDALAHAAIGGMIPASVLSTQKSKVQEAIAHQIAKSVPGGSGHVGAMESAILGKPHVLPPTLESQVSKLKSQHQAISEAAISQNLRPESPVFGDAETAATLTRSIKCGVRLLNQGPPPKNATEEEKAKADRFFEKELKENAKDPIARDKLITTKLNASVSDKKKTDAVLMKELGLTSPEQVKALRNAVPFKDRNDFVNRLGSQSGITGLKSWDTFTENLINAGT